MDQSSWYLVLESLKWVALALEESCTIFGTQPIDMSIVTRTSSPVMILRCLPALHQACRQARPVFGINNRQSHLVENEHVDIGFGQTGVVNLVRMRGMASVAVGSV